MDVRHQLNCLRDEARATRRRALSRLSAWLDDEGVVEADDVMDEFVDKGRVLPVGARARAAARDVCGQVVVADEHASLVGVFEDGVEKHRRQAVHLVWRLASGFVCAEGEAEEEAEEATVEAARATIKAVAVAVHARLCEGEEPAEEMRLAMMDLLRFCLEAAGPQVDAVLLDLAHPHLTHLAATAARDPFPDLKISAARFLRKLARTLVGALAEPPLAEAVLPFIANLRHQRSKVRVASLEALTEVAVAACETAEEPPAWLSEALFPAIQQLVFDRSAAPRAALATALSRLLSLGALSQADTATLLLQLISLVADETPPVQQAAVSALCALSASSEEQEEPASEPPALAASLMVPFESVPPSAHRLTTQHLPMLLAHVLKDLADWTSKVRLRSASNLHALLVLAGSECTGEAPRIVRAMLKAQAGDPETQPGLALCARTMGALLPLGSVLPDLWSHSADSPTPLQLLDAVVEGVAMREAEDAQQTFQAALPSVAKRLSKLANVEDESVRLQVLCVVTTVLRLFFPTNGAQGQPLPPLEAPPGRLFWALHCVRALASDPDIEATALRSLELLAAYFGPEVSVDQLYEHCFEAAIQAVTAKGTAWTRESHERLLFRGYLQVSGSVITQHLDLVFPLLAERARPDQDPSVRMDVLTVLAQVIEASETDWGAYTTELSDAIVLPNCVWRVGRSEAAVRLQALRCLEMILRRGWEPSDHAQALEALMNNLDDKDEAVRLVTLDSLGHAFQHGWVPDEMELSNTWRGLLNRLDDSRDEVRLKSLAVFAAFTHHVLLPEPRRLDGGQFEYVIKAVLVHMDDSNAEVQRAVCEFSKMLIPLNRAEFERAVKEARTKHSSTTYCDELLAALE